MQFLKRERTTIGRRTIKERVGPVSSVVHDNVDKERAVRSREELRPSDGVQILEAVFGEQARLELDRLTFDGDVGAVRPEHSDISTMHRDVAS